MDFVEEDRRESQQLLFDKIREVPPQSDTGVEPVETGQIRCTTSGTSVETGPRRSRTEIEVKVIHSDEGFSGEVSKHVYKQARTRIRQSSRITNSVT